LKLKIENLYFEIDNIKILNNINLNIKKGEFVGIIGPNGSGKSTLLKNIYNILIPTEGAIYIDDVSIDNFSSKELAKKISTLTQHSGGEFDFSILDIVLMGRYAHSSMFSSTTQYDLKIAREALKKVGLDHMESRSFLSLSGGEQQRVMIARAIVGENDFFILDEPTNHLDIRYQLEIMDIMKSLNITIFSAIHDMNIATTYCDKLILLNKGNIISIGTPNEVLTKENLNNIFGVEAYLSTNPFTQKLVINYIPKSYIK
jgi:iron complex transport system ATP-binding protein